MASYFLLPFFSSEKLWIAKPTNQDEVRHSEAKDMRLSVPDKDSSLGSILIHREVPESTLLEAAKTLDYWILWFCLFAGIGTGIMVVNNLGQIVIAVDKSPNSGNQVVFVSLLSVASATGRLATGTASEMLKHRFSRPCFLTLQLGVMTLASLLFAFVNLPILYISTFLTGIAFGSYWTLTPAILTDLFGYKSLGVIYTSIQVSCVTGSFVLSLGVAGSVYDHEASKDGNTSGVCISGSECFAVAFYVTTVLLSVATVLSVWLVKRSWEFYFPKSYAAIQ